MAWLDTAPEGSELARKETIAEPFFPDVDYGLHLVDYMGKLADKTSYTEIQSWSQLTYTPLTPWEAETLVIIGSRYESMRTKAKKIDCAEPFMSTGDADFDDDQMARLRTNEDAWWSGMMQQAANG